MLLKINSQYYNISAKEAEVLNRLEFDSKFTKSTTLLDFFIDEISLTRKTAWEEVLENLNGLRFCINMLKK